MPIIETNNLSKEFKSRFSVQKVRALNDVTFSVKEGEIFGLLGPNGAGKTTLIKILLAITFPTNGSARVFNSDARDYRWKAKVGYLPENHKFPNYLTGEQVLSYYGRLSGLSNNNEFKKKINDLFELMDLKKFKSMKVKKYSKGMMQKLGLAQAILNDPDLIFLDEPTDGVDPIGRKEIRDILLGLKEKGKTIFLNSHLLSEVELICDRVAILNKGDLVKEGSVDDLTRTEDLFIIETLEPISMDIKQKILSVDGNAGIGEREIQTESDVTTINKIVDLLRDSALNIISLNQKSKTLEEYFINVINKDNKN